MIVASQASRVFISSHNVLRTARESHLDMDVVVLEPVRLWAKSEAGEPVCGDSGAAPATVSGECLSTPCH